MPISEPPKYETRGYITKIHPDGTVEYIPIIVPVYEIKGYELRG
jgi:hypothetical protein